MQAERRPQFHGRSPRGPAALLVAMLAGLLGLALAIPAPAVADGETYVIATDTTFAPFEFQDDKGHYVGIDMDLIREIAKDQHFNVDIKPLGFDAALQAVQANQAAGVIAGMSITDARKKVFDFSEPYFESGVQMAVLASNDNIKSYEDLKGKRVAVKNGTEGAAFAESIKNHYGFSTVSFADSSSMYDEVRTGNVIAFGVDGAHSKQHIVVVAETRTDDADGLRRAITRAVTDEIGIPPREVVLVDAGTIPKTSSGKLQRAACRTDYERKAFTESDLANTSPTKSGGA